MTGRSWVILGAIVLARLGFGYQFQTVGSLGPELIPRFQMDYATFGALVGAFMLLGAFAALPLGLLGRRYGDRVILAGGLVLMCIGAVVSAGASGPGGIGAGRMVSGVGAVAIVVIQGKVLADWFQGRQFMLAISASVAAYPIGVGLGQLTQPGLAQAFGWPSAFLAGAVIQAAALLAFLVSYRPPPLVPPASRRFSLPSARECLLVAIAGMIWAAYTAGYTGYLSYLPSLMALRGDGLALTGLAVAVATWCSVPPTLLGGGLAARLGPFRLHLIGTTALVVGMVGTALTGWPVAWALVVGVIGSVHPGVIQAVGTLSTRAEHRAVGMAIFYMMYYVGGTAVPTLCGHAADAYGGPDGALLAAAAISALAIPLYALHRRLAVHDTMLAKA